MKTLPNIFLNRAAIGGETKVAEFLISLGLSINIRDTHNSTPLLSAATLGHASMIKFLIAKGADIEAVENSFSTPLDNAVFHGHCHVMELLIASGADVNFRDDIGRSLSHTACRNGFIQAVQILKENKVNDRGWILIQDIKILLYDLTIPI